MIKKVMFNFLKVYFKLFRVPFHFLYEGIKISSWTLINYVIGFSMVILLPVGLLMYFFLYIPIYSLFGDLYKVEIIEYVAHFLLLLVFSINLWLLLDPIEIFFPVMFSPYILFMWKQFMTSHRSYTWADGTRTSGDESTFLKRILNQTLLLSGFTFFFYFFSLGI
tara:strand:+ start:403 stop:897 length:495 start_codon:yes stop_codon:yes gene_type:complete